MTKVFLIVGAIVAVMVDAMLFLGGGGGTGFYASPPAGSSPQECANRRGLAMAPDLWGQRREKRLMMYWAVRKIQNPGI